MPDPAAPEEKPLHIKMRPAAFERRFLASGTDDANTLVALACDESYFVRRQAVQNPNTPQWILDLLVRAGATPDLRGKGQIDPDLSSDELRRLVEAGPWAQQLVAEHPNTSAEVLAVLKDQPSKALRLAVAAHAKASQATLAALCCAIEAEIRAAALSNPNCPADFITLLAAAGAAPDLQGVTRQYEALSAAQLGQLAELGPWGRFLAARHPDSPPALLVAIAQDPDWRVRSGLLDNPQAADEHCLGWLAETAGIDLQAIACLHRPSAGEDQLLKLALSPSPELRLAVARHPATTPNLLALLATDGLKEIRALAAEHPRIRTADLQRLIRAGSTPDLMGLSEPDSSMTAAEVRELLEGGIWARQLAVRHPNAGAGTLAQLLCDREPKIREWAAVHPNLSPETKQNLLRAGSGSDFQGIMPPDPDLPANVLWGITELGSWGAWVVANNPYAPADLLDSLANSDDWQVRMFVARNKNTPAAALSRLAQDPVTEVSKAAEVSKATEVGQVARNRF